MGLLDIVFTKDRKLNGAKVPQGMRKIEKVNKAPLYRAVKKAMNRSGK